MKILIQLARNKYFLVFFLFLVWMAFFDPRDWGLIWSRKQKLKELQQSEAHLNRQIAETRKELNSLKNGAGTIEKYAREKYLMKKDNEDLYIIKEP